MKLAVLQNLWDLYCSIFARKGLNIAWQSAKWAEQKRSSLDKYATDRSFDKLCKDGCAALPLAIAMSVFEPLRSFEKKWQTITGTRRQREQRIRAMKKSADVLEDLLGSLADVIIADSRASMDADSVDVIRSELISPNDNVLNSAAQLDVPDPSTTIRALRMYASILQMCESPQKSTNVSASDLLAKYLLSAYVHRATGRFHDKEVSALIGAALDFTYDETTHRVWRKRNYKRIDRNLSKLADIFVDFGKVSVSAT